MRHSWIAWGIWGAVAYLCANILAGIGALCAFGPGSEVCDSLMWIYDYLFPEKLVKPFLQAIDISSNSTWLVGMAIADIIIGFSIGALLAVILNTLKRPSIHHVK